LRELTPIVLKLSGLVVSPRSEGASIRWAGVTTPLSPPNWCRRQRGEAATFAWEEDVLNREFPTNADELDLEL
jgi:hypothetical protein